MRSHPPDYIFIVTVWLLVFFGLAVLASASAPLSQKRFDSPYFYFKHQIVHGLLFGTIGFLAASGIYYRRLKKLSLPLLLFTILLLLLIFSPMGISIKGAERWLKVGSFTIQPSEILKFSFLLYLASWLSSSTKKTKSLLEGFLPFLIIVSIVGILLAFQPSTGTLGILLLVAAVLYFFSGARLSFIALITIIGVVAFFALISIAPYRTQRFLTFLYPELEPLGMGYHTNQALIAIGSGGLWGKGFGSGIVKAKFLPEAMGDSIFAVLAEELGFLGVVFLVSLYLLLFLRGIRIIRNLADQFGRLLVAGFIFLVLIQAFINMAAIAGLIPLTGITLPFISYGGTSLAMLLIMMGVVANVSKHTLK